MLTIVEDPINACKKISDASTTERMKGVVQASSEKIKSLPCTIVSSASGTLEVLDLKCAHRTPM